MTIGFDLTFFGALGMVAWSTGVSYELEGSTKMPATLPFENIPGMAVEEKDWWGTLEKVE